MPEFIISIVYTSGWTEHRTAADTRHARRIVAGLKGRYPGRTITVHSVNGTTDVTAEVLAKRGK
ncbi:hypothetical protein ACKI10_18110 [Streptomyces galilaeus]|uniref:hypothetical protein n=1 Tax=Streptomyces galilaeus TaxID=33899 RepID=UPI0038F6A290